MEVGQSGKKPFPTSSTTPAPSPKRERDGGEQEEVEKFYGLIGRIRELRDLCGASSPFKRMKKEAVPLWKPTFELEDFERQDDAESSAAAAATLEEKRRKEKGKMIKEDSLDLNLSL
ncbi:hypothetical protein Cni_G01137 [Canna indica]|uniref:Uncharacterized protein n=1 Tax=Canna indica TaxID=4628 RepID=A0AAQ3JML5_9LILI|nr:hypothetical protein Cni_G01137 [Canna indica]